MDEWPVEKKQRVFEILEQLHLQKSLIVLDFGCGNGIFTEIIRQALPGWKVYGCDISQLAIAHTKKRFAGCDFFVSGEGDAQFHQFDFLFSHHVLEHVYDAAATLVEIGQYLKPDACALQIFPCGN